MLRKFKGPLAFPLIGNCYSVEALSLLRYLSNLRRRFGRIFTFFALSKPYLVICDPIVVRRVLSDTKTFVKGSDYTSQFSVAFGTGLVTSNGEKHKSDRACFGKYFIRSNIAKYMSRVNDITVRAMSSLLKVDGKPFNIEHFFARLALRTFMDFSVGTDYVKDQEREEYVCNAVAKGSWAMGRMITMNLPMWDIFPLVQQIKHVRKIIWEDMKPVLEERRAALERGELTDIDDCLSAMIKEKMSNDDVIDHMVTLICAGHDTTAFFSAYLCMLLAQNPACQETLRAEINTVLGARNEINGDDVSTMKYLQKVMQETLRLYAIIPCVTRLASDEVHIKEADITIPKGSNLLVPMFLINRDPELWENPSEFNPERFSGQGNEFTSAKSGFFPFGYGARTCIGNTFAQMESAVFICQLLRKYRLVQEPGFKPAIFAGISLTTSNGINVILKDL